MTIFKDNNGKFTTSMSLQDRKKLNMAYHDAQQKLTLTLERDPDMILYELNLRKLMYMIWNPYLDKTLINGKSLPPPNQSAKNHQVFYNVELNNLAFIILQNGWKFKKEFVRGAIYTAIDLIYELMKKIKNDDLKNDIHLILPNKINKIKMKQKLLWQIDGIGEQFIGDKLANKLNI